MKTQQVFEIISDLKRDSFWNRSIDIQRSFMDPSCMYVLDANKPAHCQLVVAGKIYSPKRSGYDIEGLVGTRGILEEAHTSRETRWKAAEGGKTWTFDMGRIKLTKDANLVIADRSGAEVQASLINSRLRDPVTVADVPGWLRGYKHRCLELKQRGVYLFVVPSSLNKGLKIKAKSEDQVVLRRSERGHHSSGYGLRVRKPVTKPMRKL